MKTKHLSDQEISWMLLDYIYTTRSESVQSLCSQELFVLLCKRNVNEQITEAEWGMCKQEYAEFYKRYEKYCSSEHAFKQKIIQTVELFPNSVDQKWLVALSVNNYLLQFKNESELLERFDFAFPLWECENREKIKELFSTAICCGLQSKIECMHNDTYLFTLSFIFDWEYWCSQLYWTEKVEWLQQLYVKCNSVQVATVKRDSGLLPFQKVQYFGYDSFTELFNKKDLLNQVKYVDRELDSLLYEYQYWNHWIEHKDKIYATIKNNGNRVTYIRYLLQTWWVNKNGEESNESRIKWTPYHNFCNYINELIQSSPQKVLIVSEVVLKPWAKDKEWNAFQTPFFTDYIDFENWLSHIFWWTVPEMIKTDLVKYFSKKECINFNIDLELHISPSGTSITDDIAYEFLFEVAHDFVEDNKYDWKNSQELFYTCNDLKDCYSIIQQCNVDNDSWSSILLPQYDELDIYAITRARELTEKKIIQKFDSELYVRMETLVELFENTNDPANNDTINTILISIVENETWYDFLLALKHDNSLERLQKIIDLRKSNDFVIYLNNEYGYSDYELILYKKHEDDMKSLRKIYTSLNKILWYRIWRNDFFRWKQIYFSISWQIQNNMIELYIEFSWKKEKELITFSPIVSLETLYAIIQSFTDTSTGIDDSIRWESQDYGTLWLDYDDDEDDEVEF